MRKTLLTLLALAVCCLAVPATAAEKFDLPDDMLKLLPADAAAVVAVSSVNEMIAEYLSLMEAVGEGEDADRAEILSGLDHSLDGFSELIDFDRPLLMTSGIPDLMGNEEPPLTFILPLVGTVYDSHLAAHEVLAGGVREGDYIGFATPPGYTPGGAASALTDRLADGVISVVLDVEALVLNFRPFIEMGLAGIPMRPADASADSVPGYTAEEAAVLAQTIREVMDSATHLEMRLGRDNELITWFTGLGVKPGSALDPGPQPDFDRAMALTGALPADADFLQVLALDQTRMFETFREYYLVSMRSALGSMPADQAERYNAWVEQYLAGIGLWANPMAASLRIEGEAMVGHIVMATDEAQAAVDHMADILDGMTDLGIGYVMTRRDTEKIAGVKFQAWDMAFDLEQFEAAMPPTQGPALSGTERLQAEQIIAILQKIMPSIYIGAKGDHLFMASTEDTKDLARLVKQAGKGSKALDEVKRVARKAGPGCQQVITGDLLAIMKWVSEMMEDLGEEELDIVLDNPIPFEAVMTVNGTDFGFDMGMDLAAFGGLVQAIAEMEEAQKEEAAEAQAVEPH